MNTSNKRRCRKEVFLESCAAILKSKECTWYNEHIEKTALQQNEYIFIESCLTDWKGGEISWKEN